MTYRLSQDHLETFFSRLRRRHGWNNNPTGLQLKHTLRHILLKNSVTASTNANCMDSDIRIQEAENALVSESAFVGEITSNPKLQNFVKILNSPSQYHDHVLYYISGYILRSISKKIQCRECSDLLVAACHKVDEASTSASFTIMRDRGGLLYCNDMFKLIKAVDNEVRLYLTSPSGPLFSVDKNFTARVTTKVITYLLSSTDQIFSLISTHSMQYTHLESEDSHWVQVVKAACKLFVTIILHHHEKLLQDRVILQGKGTRRHQRNKLTLFQNQ